MFKLFSSEKINPMNNRASDKIKPFWIAEFVLLRHSLKIDTFFARVTKFYTRYKRVLARVNYMRVLKQQKLTYNRQVFNCVF